MKSLATILFSIYFLSIACPPIESIAQVAGEGSHEKDDIVLKWLGNAGWEIRVGKTILLIDPFLTRQEGKAGVQWKSDEDAVLKAISKADFIFAGHSHADHIGDVPFLAKKFGAKIIGSRTTTNIALTLGVDKSQLTAISGGEKLKFDDFSVQVIESEHGTVRRSGRTRRSKSEEITQPWTGPVMGNDFVEGGSYLYYFSFGNYRVLHQSTAGFIEEKLTALQPDVLLLAATQRVYDLTSVLKILNPKTIVLHHFDEWRAPIERGIPEANRKRAERFAAEIQAVNPNIRVIIPEFFRPINVEQ